VSGMAVDDGVNYGYLRYLLALANIIEPDAA